MILGTYWYFGFPTGLYNFDLFEFSQGCGGHADNYAELSVAFESVHAEKIIAELKQLTENYPNAYLFIFRDLNKMRIGTGSYQLFDYDFLFMLKVEKVLKDYQVKSAKDLQFDQPKQFSFYNETVQKSIVFPKKRLVQIVGSELRKYNAENAKVRFDGNLLRSKKENFIRALKDCVKRLDISIFYYYESEVDEITNLILFFTLGRQGLNLTPIQFVNVSVLENKIETAMNAFEVRQGHIEGFNSYPQGEPIIVLGEQYELKFIL